MSPGRFVGEVSWSFPLKEGGAGRGPRAHVAWAQSHGGVGRVCVSEEAALGADAAPQQCQGVNRTLSFGGPEAPLSAQSRRLTGETDLRKSKLR